jgi:hypothetical protein
MALIKCPECGKEVSSSAATCPQCGHPITPTFATEFSKALARPPVKKSFGFVGCLGIVLIIGGLSGIGTSIFGGMTWEQTGEKVTTRGWLRAAIEKKPELEIAPVHTQRPTTDGERVGGAIFGVFAITLGGWLVKKRLPGPTTSPTSPTQ